MTEHKIIIAVIGKNQASGVFGKVGSGVKGLGGKVKGLGKSFDGLKSKTSGLAGGLMKLAGGAAMIGVAKASIQASLGADRYLKSLEGLAGSAKEATGFIEGIQSASLGTISKMDAMAISSKALSLKVVDNAGSMKELTEVAITLGRAQGLSATQSVDDLTTALGRQSPLILDNLGITLKMSEAHKIYAGQLGKDVKQLTDAEKSQAFLNAALVKGKEVASKLGGVQLDAAAQGEKLTAQMSDMSIILGDALVPAFSVFVGLASSALTTLEPLLVTFAEMTAGLGEMNAAMETTETVAAGMGDQFAALVDGGMSTGDALEVMAGKIDKGNAVIDDMTGLQKFAAAALGKTGAITHKIGVAQVALNKSIASGSGSYKDYIGQLNKFNKSATNSESKIDAMTQAQFKWQKSFEKGAVAMEGGATLTELYGGATDEASQAQVAFSEAVRQHALATGELVPQYGSVTRESLGLSKATAQQIDLQERAAQATFDNAEAMENNVGFSAALALQQEVAAGSAGRAASAAERQAASILASSATLEQKRQKNIATAQTEVGLASSMVDVTEAALAQTFIQGLDADAMGLTAYQAAVETIQLSFGLATPESIALSRGITQGVEAANSGALAYKDLDQFIVALKADAVDGNVDFDTLSRTFASSSAQAGFLTQRIDATGNAIVDNVAKTESLIAAEAGLEGVTRQVKDQMTGFGDVLPNIASGGELWTNTIDGSKRALDDSKGTAQEWMAVMAGLDERMVAVGENTLGTGEKIAATNAVFERGATPTENAAANLDAVGEAHAIARVPVEEFAGAVSEIPEGMDAAANAAPTAITGVTDFGMAAGEAVSSVDLLAASANALGDAMSGIPGAAVPTTGGGGGGGGTQSMADGGIVPGNSRQAVPIIAHGGERVVPVGQSVGATGAPSMAGNTTNFNRAGDTVILQGEAAVNRYMHLRQREDKLARHSARM